MTKKYLEQYTDLQKEIKGLEKRIEKLERQSHIVSDVVQNGYKRHAVITGVDYKRQGKINRLKKLMEQRKEEALNMQIKIEEFIGSIDDSRIRQIFEYRYYEGLKWFQIASMMKYKGESAPRMIHDRYLEKIL